MPYSFTTVTSSQEKNLCAVLPSELWAHIVEHVSSWDAAVLSRHLGVGKTDLQLALITKAAVEYKFPCPTARKVRSVPCACDTMVCGTPRHVIVRAGTKGKFMCCSYGKALGCKCTGGSLVWVDDEDHRQAVALVRAEEENARDRKRFQGCRSEYEEMLLLDEQFQISCEREYLRKSNDDLMEEEDLGIWALFWTRGLKSLGPKGADEQGSDPVPMPPTLDQNTVADDTVPDPVQEAGIPVETPRPVLPEDEAAKEYNNSGHVYSPVLENERSGQPVDTPSPVGWLNWENADGDMDYLKYSGSIMRSDRHTKWVPELQQAWNSQFKIGHDMMRDIKAKGKTIAMSITTMPAWGYGDGSPDATITKAGFVDKYEVVQCTLSDRTVMIPLARDTIAYNVPFGMSVYGQAMPYNSVAGTTPVSQLYAELDNRLLTDKYHKLIMTASQKGNNHIALGATMIMRLTALEILHEQGAQAYIDITAQEFNRVMLPVDRTNNSATVKVARAVVEHEPYNLVTLPPHSILSDASLMYYLMGNARAKTTVTAGGSSPQFRVMSAVDMYIPETKFILSPLINKELIEKRKEADDEQFTLDPFRAKSLFSRYMTANNLWQQFPVMRAFAWSVMAHPATSVNLRYPAPLHTADLQLNLFTNPATIDHKGLVFGQRDNITSLHASVVVAARMAEEVMTDAIVSAATEAGIMYTNPAYTATIEQELGRHLYLGYSHLIMPIVEKLLGDVFPELTQYLSDSVLALEHCTAGRDLDRKKFRASSYLCMDETPEGEGWQVVFSESRRKQILSSDYCTEREALVCSWVSEKHIDTNDRGVTYYQHEMLPIESVSDTPVVRGHLGKARLDYLRGSPVLWGISTETISYTHVVEKKTKVVVDDKTYAAPTGMFARMHAKMEAARLKINVDQDMAENLGLEQPAKEKGFTHSAKPAMQSKRPTNSRPTNDVAAREPVTAPTNVDGFTVVKGGQRAKKVAGPQPIKVWAAIVPPAPKVEKQTTPRTQKTGKQTKPNWRTKKMTAAEEDKLLTSMRKANKPTVAPTRNAMRLSELLEKSSLTAAERKELDTFYDRGKDAGLKRAPYTAAVLWTKRHMIAANKSRVEHLRTAMINGIYGKNAWMVTLGLWILTNTMSEACFGDLITAGILDTKYEHWNSKWAAYNDLVRNKWAKGLFAHTDDDLVQCLYIANMVGRAHREADWDEEERKRTAHVGEIKMARRGKMVELNESELEEEIMEMLLQEGNIKIKEPQDFIKFYAKRANWMIKGSASGEKMIMSDYKRLIKEVKDEGVELRERATKTDVAEYVTAEQVIDLTYDVAIHLAKAHTKGNEHGKLRAIYGSLYAHYVIGSYWSTYLEDTVYFKSASMNKENSKLIAETMARSRSCKQGRWIVCLDYADFNAQHSGNAQRCVIKTIYKWAKLKGFAPTEEFDRVSNWYAESFTNQWFQRPDNKKWVQATSGMFSGVRQTTLINTVLNLTYHRIGLKNCYNLGQKVECLQAYVLGDDGWVEFSTKEEAEMYIVAAKLGGMEINAIKQLVSQGRGEYLRLIYGQDGGVRGCPVRSLSSFVHGNVENRQASVGQQRISEMYSQACMLTRRGLAANQWQKVFEDLAVYEIGYAGDVSRAQCLKFLYGSKKSGGMGLMPIGYQTDRVARLPVASEEDAGETDLKKVLAGHLMEERIANKFKASGEYVSQIEKEYGVIWKHEGKLRATASTAAENLVEGVVNIQLEHTALKMRVLRAQLDKKLWAEAMSWDRWTNGPLIGPENIEKQYRSFRISEDRLMSTVTRIAKLSYFMSEESIDAVQQKVAADLDVTLAAVKHAFTSAGVLRGESVDYIPQPLMAPELEGVYTQWLTVNKDESRTKSIPGWISDYTKVLKY
nr:polyprotein [Alternaria alternata botybirnavirus 1]